MTKTIRNSGAATEESFHKHYAAIWGAERWHTSLYPALAERTRHAALVNRYVPRAAFFDNVKEHCNLDQLKQLSFPVADFRDLDGHSGVLCFTCQPRVDEVNGDVSIDQQDLPLPQPKLDTSALMSQRLFTHWNLDAASALAVHLLNVHATDNVLDLCAAPGGKSIAIAQNIWPQHHEDVIDWTKYWGTFCSASLSTHVVYPSEAGLNEEVVNFVMAELPKYVDDPSLIQSFATKIFGFDYWLLPLNQSQAEKVRAIPGVASVQEQTHGPCWKGAHCRKQNYDPTISEIVSHETSTSPTLEPRLGRLTSNELDATRYKRLTSNIQAYLPAQLCDSKHISTSRVDCTDPLATRKLSTGGSGYDRVLVDAPCSSERHIIHAHLASRESGRDAPEMKTWRPGSSKRLAKMQVEILMTGLRAAKVGGIVMYATCSLEPTENDGVIEKMLSVVQKEVQKGGKWTVRLGFDQGKGNVELERQLERDWAERTKYGWIVLPDHPGGGRWGPLYFVLIKKVVVSG